MTIPADYKGKYFFHFTHLENLESILKNGFLSTNEKKSRNIEHTDIANENIQNRRSEMDVTCSPFGKVHDYVPFYFATTNPMLLGITRSKNIDQPYLIFFAVSIEKVLEKYVVFTSSSANTAQPPVFYDSPNDLDKLDWSAINETKWGDGGDEDFRHRRMSEVLVNKEVPLDWIEYIIVWNKAVEKETKRIYKECNINVPNIAVYRFNGRYFYYTKFKSKRNKNNETLVCGPYILHGTYKSTIKYIKEKRKEIDLSKSKFSDINDALKKLENNFCVIPELSDIFELETDNSAHNNNVSDHTLKVVESLVENSYYNELSKEDKEIVKLSAYLHDIGKGPKSDWEDGIQKDYPDHTVDGLEMLKRILSEDFTHLSNGEIKMICLLVGYHDLIGDILVKGRKEKELLNLKLDENKLNMLIALSLSDVQAINSMWHFQLNLKLSNFVERIKKEIS
ncbi:MAG: DUF4433 domain-containing protein [Bacteroidetes bacterium HGW-Bacteroidetes-21]|jgi:putative nucleotidyltransferase with HDIG domain|nr:MAG: DUF4433 domain-containing protein [Bacteroidetes bacterium HGW-Bacteroidetes-21]